MIINFVLGVYSAAIIWPRVHLTSTREWLIFEIKECGSLLRNGI